MNLFAAMEKHDRNQGATCDERNGGGGDGGRRVVDAALLATLDFDGRLRLGTEPSADLRDLDDFE